MTAINARIHRRPYVLLFHTLWKEQAMNIEAAMHKGAKWVSPETPVTQIAELMRRDDIGSVPVGENDRLVGMITDRDLALRAFSNGADPLRLKARDVMSKGIVYCRTDQSVEDAIHMMEDKKIRRLPVINGDKRLVGMLSLSDVSHHASRELSGELVHAVATPHTNGQKAAAR
jgi:CBS domain-containing protein